MTEQHLPLREQTTQTKNSFLYLFKKLNPDQKSGFFVFVINYEFRGILPEEKCITSVAKNKRNCRVVIKNDVQHVFSKYTKKLSCCFFVS